MSQNTGVNPACIIGETFVDHVQAGKSTLSPRLRPYFIFNASTNIKFADDPELTKIEYLQFCSLKLFYQLSLCKLVCCQNKFSQCQFIKYANTIDH